MVKNLQLDVLPLCPAWHVVAVAVGAGGVWEGGRAGNVGGLIGTQGPHLLSTASN